MVAVGGLLFAIFQLGGGSNGDDPDELQPEPPAVTTDGPPDQLPPPEPGERTELEPTTGGDEERASLASQDYFSNVLTGLVLTVDKRPVEDAEVTLTRSGPAAMFFQNDPQDRSKDRTVKTDAKGSYRFNNVEPFERYGLEVVAEGYSTATASNVAVDVEGTFTEPPIILTTGAMLYGRVEDSGKNLVPDAVLHLDGSFYRPGAEPGPDRLSAVSDSAGHYEILNVPPGNRSLTVMADGYANVQVGGLVFRGDQSVERNITLEIAERISGTVVSQSGAPVPEADVLAMSFSNSNRQCREGVKTDERGQFTLERLAAGQYTIAVKADGYRPGHESRVKTGESNLIIELVEQPTINGRVVAIDTGQPVPKYKVRIRQTYPQTPLTTPIGTEETFTKEDGSFSLTSPGQASYVVQATADGYAPSYSDTFRVTQGQSVNGILVTLTTGGSITGTVIGSDGPVPRALVTTHDNTWSNSLFDQALGDEFPTNATLRTARGNKEGMFKVGGLKAETYQIRIKAPGYCEYVKQDILVKEGVATQVDGIVLTRGGKITGKVLNAAGEPTVANVSLMPDGRQPGMPRRYKVKSGADGNYVLANIHPGAYKLTASSGRGDGDFLGQFQSEKNSMKQVTVSDGQDLRFDLQLGN